MHRIIQKSVKRYLLKAKTKLPSWGVYRTIIPYNLELKWKDRAILRMRSLNWNNLSSYGLTKFDSWNSQKGIYFYYSSVETDGNCFSEEIGYVIFKIKDLYEDFFLV